MSSSSLLRGSAALVIWGSQKDLAIQEERDLNNWWTNEHLPERLAIDGFHRTRRYYYSSKDDKPLTLDAGKSDEKEASSKETSVSHYLVLYEVASLATLTSDAYMHALNNPTSGTKKYMPVLASMNRSACRVLLSKARDEFSQCKVGGVGGTFAHVLFNSPSTTEAKDGLQKYLRSNGWQMLTKFFPSLLAIHLLEPDGEASKSGSSTKSYENVSFQSNAKQEQQWMLFAEFSDALDAPSASYKDKCSELATGLAQNGVDLATVKEEIYGLVVVMEE